MSREFFVMNNLGSFLRLFFFAILFCVAFALSTQAQEKKINLVVFGDSLVAGFGLGPGEAFPEKLEIALNKKEYYVSVTNAGVSGDTTSSGLARLDWSIPDTTNAVILELGANDALRGIPHTVTRKNLIDMVERLKSRNISILLAGMLAPPNMGEDYAAEFNPIYAELAKTYDLLFYPFFLDGVAGQTELNQADAMHPTAKGIELIVEKMLPTVEKFLKSIE